MDPHGPRLAEFLARQSEKQFCGRCLALKLICSLDDARSALAALSGDTALSRGAGQCAACGGWSVVYGHAPGPPDARPPEERLSGFLGKQAGAFFCNTCLCRELRMSPYVVRKAVDRLRMARTARLQGGRCATCERLRLVIGRDLGAQGGATRPGIA